MQDGHSETQHPYFPTLFSFPWFVFVFQTGSDSVAQAGILLTPQAGLELEILLPQTECQITGVYQNRKLPSASRSHGKNHQLSIST